MKYIHVFLLILSATVLAVPAAVAQGGPPAPPPAEGPAIPEPDDEIIAAPTDREESSDSQADREDNTVLPAEEPATDIPPQSTRTVIPNMAPSQRQGPKLQSFKFEGADLDTVMTMYCEWTGKIYLKNDSVTASISLNADRLTIPECINVVESILAMNNIAIVPHGEKFIKVVQANSADLTGEGLKININPDTEYTGSDTLVTQIIPLRNVQIPEVQNAIQHIMHSYGKIQTLEGSNSLMITDTESNILRIRELVDFMDQASARIEPRIYEIMYAEATEIAAKLNEIITMAQSDQKTASSARGTTARTTARVIRARGAQPSAAATPTRAAISSSEAGSRMIIQGTAKVMADERTNLILIFSQEENFAFFDKIIKVLDVEVEPATTFEVVSLEYADAGEMAGTLNDLIGAASGGSRPGSSGTSSRTASSRSNTSRSNTSRSNTSGSRTGSSATVTPNASPNASPASIENLNRLSEDTKILADERSNAVLLMGRKSDIAAIKTVIKQLDIMLEQVMIEAAIFEVTLDDNLRHGIDWLYQDDNGEKIGAWDGLALSGTNGGISTVTAGALSYYQNITGINTEIAINLAASDSNVRLLSTPVIITTDNTEASLIVGQQRPIVTSTSSFANSSGTQSSTYEYKDIGVSLTVTPRINPQRVVVMEVLQQADQVGGSVSIDGNDVPIILNREFEAQLSVPDRGTVALGGLIESKTDDAVTKIPILGDIPLIGRYLFSSITKETSQTELIVLMTPTVLANLDEATQQTDRLYDSIDMQQEDWPPPEWSGSDLQYRPKTNDWSAD